MSTLDRAFQRQILEMLRESYPESRASRDMGMDAQDRKWVVNASYLAEHGLITCLAPQMVGTGPEVLSATLTANGIDFIENDGGLSAILGVVTIRLHDDTIKQLVAARIAAADLPQPDKQRMLDQLRELPAEATKHLVLKGLDKLLDAGPAAIEWLGKMLSQAAG